MSESKSSSTNYGVSFSSLLFITFLVLKLTKVIAWSWWWVTAPLWMPIALIIPFVLIIAIFAAFKKKRR